MKKKKKRIVWKVIGVILLLLICVGMYYRKTVKAVFYNNVTPTVKLLEEDDWNGGKTYLKVPYGSVSENQYVDIYVPDDAENPPLFVLVHGGGFIVNDSQARQTKLMYRYFRDHGYAVATVNYRLAQEAEYPGALEDVKTCIRFLKSNAAEYGYNPEKVALFGESAGAYLAIMASVTDDTEFSDQLFIGEEKLTEPVSAKVNVLVDFYGAMEFGNDEARWKELGYPLWLINLANSWIKGDAVEGYESSHSFWIRKNESTLSDEEKEQYSARYYLNKNKEEKSDLNIWISHGDCDITVPITSSQEFYEETVKLLGEDQVQLNIVKHAGHAKDIMYSEEELAKIDDFLKEKMK